VFAFKASQPSNSHLFFPDIHTYTCFISIDASGGSGATSSLVPLSQFRFRLAPDAVSVELTGFAHNAVTPFGLKTAGIPVGARLWYWLGVAWVVLGYVGGHDCGPRVCACMRSWLGTF